MSQGTGGGFLPGGQHKPAVFSLAYVALLGEKGLFLITENSGNVQEAWSVFAAKSGIKLFAGKGNIDIQAHEGKLGLVADQEVQIVSATASAEMLAKTSIRLAAGGCELLLKDGKLILKMPGDLEIHAAGMKMMGAANPNTPLPKLPKEDLQLPPSELRKHISA